MSVFTSELHSLFDHGLRSAGKRELCWVMTGEASVSFFIRRRRNWALKPLGFPLDNYEQTGLMRWDLTEHVRIRALGLERNEGFSLHFKENFCIAASRYFCGDISAKLDKDGETENRRWGLLASRLAEAHVLLSVLTLKIPKLIWRHNYMQAIQRLFLQKV